MAEIADMALALLVRIKASQPACVVTVINGSNSTTGIRSSRRGVGELVDVGVMAPDAETVWVSSSAIGDVVKGWGVVTVGGTRVNVLSTSDDPGRGLKRIDYTTNTET